MLFVFFVLANAMENMERFEDMTSFNRCSVLWNDTNTEVNVEYYPKTQGEAGTLDWVRKRVRKDSITLLPNQQKSVCIQEKWTGFEKDFMITITPAAGAPVSKETEIPTKSRKSIQIINGIVELHDKSLKKIIARDENLIDTRIEEQREIIVDLEEQKQLAKTVRERIEQEIIPKTVRVEYFSSSAFTEGKYGDLLFVDSEIFLVDNRETKYFAMRNNLIFVDRLVYFAMRNNDNLQTRNDWDGPFFQSWTGKIGPVFFRAVERSGTHIITDQAKFVKFSVDGYARFAYHTADGIKVNDTEPSEKILPLDQVSTHEWTEEWKEHFPKRNEIPNGASGPVIDHPAKTIHHKDQIKFTIYPNSQFDFDEMVGRL